MPSGKAARNTFRTSGPAMSSWKGRAMIKLRGMLTSHARGNMNLGNDKDFLIRVVSQCLPYIGYPRSLNAIACINKAAEG